MKIDEKKSWSYVAILLFIAGGVSAFLSNYWFGKGLLREGLYHLSGTVVFWFIAFIVFVGLIGVNIVDKVNELGKKINELEKINKKGDDV